MWKNKEFYEYVDKEHIVHLEMLLDGVIVKTVQKEGTTIIHSMEMKIANIARLVDMDLRQV